MKTDMQGARLPRAVLRPGASWHGPIDLIAVDLVLAVKRPHTVLDDDHKLYAIVHRPGTTAEKARRLGLAERTVATWAAAHGAGSEGGDGA